MRFCFLFRVEEEELKELLRDMASTSFNSHYYYNSTMKNLKPENEDESYVARITSKSKINWQAILEKL